MKSDTDDKLPSIESNLFEAMALEAVQIALGGNIKRGISLALNARGRARAAQDERAELAALSAASRCHSMNNDALASFSSGIDAQALAQKLGDQRSLGHALCSIASSAFVLRLLDASIPVAERAIAEAVDLHDDDLESRARVILGENLGNLQRFDEARRQLELALEAARRLGAAGLQNRAHAKLGTLAAKEAEYFAARDETSGVERACSVALQCANEIILLAKEQRNSTLVVSMLGLRARVHEFRGEWVAARDETAAALALARQSAYLSPIPPWSLRLAALLIREGDFAGARSTLEEGLRTAENLRPSFRIGELCEALMQLEQRTGDTAAAAQWQERVDDERRIFEVERERASAILAAHDWRRPLQQ